MTRLTNAFPKNVGNLEHAVAPHFRHYNFCRVHVHQSLRVTPAMEAGVADHVGSLEEVIVILDRKSKGWRMTNIFTYAGPGSRYQLPKAKPAGFWAGLWHGLIAGLAFLQSLFTPTVRIYEKNNQGRLYDFGFLMGILYAYSGLVASWLHHW
jgi:hypothetical protein